MLRARLAPTPRGIASKSTGQRALHSALGRYFDCYARYFLQGEWGLPAFSAVQHGAELEIEVQAPDGPQLIRRRAGAYLSLAGAFWGASRGPSERTRLPVLIPALTAWPLGDANGWDQFHDFSSDEKVLDALHDVALCLMKGARSEAILLLRRALEVDDNWSEPALPLRRPVPSQLSAAIGARTAVVQPLLTKNSYSPGGVAKAVVGGAQSADASERLAAAVCLSSAASFLSSGNHLRFLQVVEPAIKALLLEGDGAAHEIAIGLAQQLGAKLLSHGAYPEAKRMLDLQLAHHVGVAEALRAR